MNNQSVLTAGERWSLSFFIIMAAMVVGGLLWAPDGMAYGRSRATTSLSPIGVNSLGASSGESAANAAAAASEAPPHLDHKQRIALAWQIALAANNFSPGILDASFGPNSRRALRQYANSFFPGVNPFDRHDPRIFDALHVDVAHVWVWYTISQTDQDAVGTEHYHWLTMAAARRMPYASLEDCILEKFHCTRALLQRLNPHVPLSQLQAGQKIRVPNIRPFPGPDVDFGVPGGMAATLDMDRHGYPPVKAAYLTINFQQRAIRVFNANNQEEALFKCSIAAHKQELPSVNDAKIAVIAVNPNYTFIPSSWPEVHGINRRLIIPPGPRNPVGVVWMGLNIPGVGIHGNPVPQYIGITGSHGCFRMTNWDAVHLFTMIKVGTRVVMINAGHPVVEAEDVGEQASSGSQHMRRHHRKRERWPTDGAQQAQSADNR
ncbi:MAG: L,D-transpeptidase [Phycisphaerales bacterium]|nr:L,D-transpeptidase [Phycisphaerales bacterium]